jgi:hypothetical protein
MPRFRPCVTALEDRLVLSTFTEVEPNDLPAQANTVVIAEKSIIDAVPSDWLEISATTDPATDVDWFEFTLDADFTKYGVFFDIDSRDTRLSATLDSFVAVYDGGGVNLLASNNNGYDFEGFVVPNTAGEDSALSFDSSLYFELAPGTYQIRVTALNNTAGPYRLRLLADSNFATTVPVLNSFADSLDTLYLDFDGHTADPNNLDEWNDYMTLLPFDFSGNGTEFTPAEQLAIQNVWRVVSEDYAPFNLNVTTVEPAAFGDGFAHRHVITQTSPTMIPINPPLTPGTLGVTVLNSYASANVVTNLAFTFANQFPDFFEGLPDDASSGLIMATALEIGNTTSHEFGHALGLYHYGGTNSRNNALMQTPDTGINRETWSAGRTHSGESPVITQDDMAVISNLANTFGYLPDDHASGFANPTKLKAIGNVFTRKGIISTPAGDLDFFRLDLPNSGLMTIKVDVDEYLNNLDATLQLFDVNRVLLATADPNGSFDASITRQLKAGTYYLRVGSDGEAGEAGRYTVQVAQADFATYLRSVFQDLFDRDPMAQELTKWTGQLQQGVSPTQVVAKIMNSDEYRGIVVTELFDQYLNRMPTPGELDRYVADLRNGVRREQLQIRILSGSEYFQLQGGTNSAFLQGLYQDVVGQPIDPATLAQYLQALDFGVSRATIVKKVVSGTPALERVVTGLFQQYLNRAPTATELAGYVTKLQSSLGGLTVEGVIARLLSSNEYFALALA